MSKAQIFLKGLVKENPVLVLILGTCPTLAVSTNVMSALGMGAASTIVLLCSNIVISALRNVIPDKVRIPCYIVLIAGFVTMVQMLVKAFAPALDKALGIYLPLITTNCAVLGITMLNITNELSFVKSLFNALGAGLGFMLAMLLFSGVRERLETADIPEFLKGLPITLVAAALVALSFLGFAGIGG